MNHASLAAEFVQDRERAHWHDQALWFVRARRDRAARELPEWELLRETAARIKAHTQSRLADYLEQFEEQATRRGARVHWARDAAEHNRIVLGILQGHGVRRLVKSKSMLTEECHLNPFLQSHGIEVIDTDLGERIVQLAGEAPSHIVLPAIHKKKEDVGALFTDRVHDWELYKLRMLNATHSCLAYLMAIEGVVYVDEAVAIPTVRRYLERFLATEAIPTLTEIPGHPAADYAATVLGRFENTGVRDQIARLCIDGTAKFPSFLIPTIERQLELDGPVECAALALAGWARYLGTVPAAERAHDSQGDRAATFAVRSLDEPRAFLEFDQVFTPRLRESDRFGDAFAAASRALAKRGSIGAMEQL